MTKKHKILLASETYPPDVNGAAIFVQRLAQMLSEDGHEVLVIAPSTSYKDKWEDPSKLLRIFRVKSVSFKPIHPYFRTVWKTGLTKKISKVVQEFEPDIIHIHNHFLLGRTCIKIAKKSGIPVMGTNHFMPENLTEYFPKILEKSVSQYMWKDFIKTYNKLDYVTAPTKVALSMIKDLGLKVPSKVISNGIDLNEFKKVIINKSSYKNFGLDKTIPIFLFVGRLERDKNIDIVLEALNLNRDKIKFKMVIVGKGKDEIVLKKMAKTLNLGNSVLFTGKVSDYDLKQLYALTNVYIGSGSAELQGLAVMEAMANGLPVLAANAVALPELVKNGVNGYLFDLNPKDLAEKMIRILNSSKKLKHMSKYSLDLIEKHSKDHTLELFLKIYENIISSSKNYTNIS